MIINYSLYDNHQIIGFGDNLSYKTSQIITHPHFRGIGTYTKNKSDISFTKNKSDISFTKNKSDISYN